MVFLAKFSTLILSFTDVRRLQLFFRTNCNFIVICVSDLTEFLYGICTIFTANLTRSSMDALKNALLY